MAASPKQSRKSSKAKALPSPAPPLHGQSESKPLEPKIFHLDTPADAGGSDPATNKRIPASTIQLQFAGELILVKSPDRKLAGLFRRYEALFETFANMDRVERLINYKFLNALMLTSHAKKIQDTPQKKKLFDLKNQIYFDLANGKDSRRKVIFRYLASKNFRVIKFCEACIKKNTDEAIERHRWKFCPTCEVDRNFYNVLSMQHKFDKGHATLFLSNDLMHKVTGLQLQHKGKLGETKEEAMFQRYHYNVKNLDAFTLESVLKMYEKLMTPH